MPRAMARGPVIDPAIVPGLALYLATILVIARYFYLDAFWSFAADIRSPSYSYLAVVLFSVLATLWLVVRDGVVTITRSIPPLRILSALLLILLGILLYIVALLEPSYQLHVEMLSFLIVAWGLMAVLFRFNSMLGAIPFLSLIALIPIPSSVLDNLSIELSKLVGRIVAATSPATLQSSPLGIYLVVPSPSGSHVLEITFACSGVLSLASVISILPLVIYLAARPAASLPRKLVAITLSVIVASLIVFAGNVVRVWLVVREMHLGNTERAMSIFHQLPSAIYVAVAVAASLLIIPWIVGYRWDTRRGTEEPRGWPSGVFLAFTFLGLFVLFLYHLLAPGIAVAAQLHGNTSVPSFTEIATKPQEIFNGTGVKVLRAYIDHKLSRLLGETSLVTTIIKYNNRVYTGYIEVAESPSRFHSWSVCLGYQGYVVTSQKTILLGNQAVKVFEALKNGQRYLLAYTVYRVKASFGPVVRPVYLKVSILKRINTSSKDLASQLGDVRAIFEALARKTGQPGLKISQVIERVTESIYAVLAITILYLGASMLYRRRLSRQ